ncbi:ATP-dependent exoDNAse (exonuclease V), alpha subunit, helicase superfamily I [Streptomyces sp. LamerLS-316]|uniref:helix-hairpin-helix domain-containing protein n=1 Tax=unclassified Streptomyces TaxID=2593676 RepID=UPI00082389CA|nr:helix-hairpin-helix domain-containing protein [Streptomyces sp. LamerLS-316]MYQ37223.1 ATP-binding domain-containing protein [Streptomyces sp. SID4921]SCK21984.1 ATP-dependent exoDNAse (exonuclease V), alpha subunit, helicase superfamily I [Streptomyces sp. LamerLS-316]
MTAHPRGETPDPAAEDHEAVEDSGPQAADTPGTPDEGGAGSTEGADDGAAGAEGAPDLEQATGASEAPAAPALSEAEAELAAQRELRERIERRKAEKEGPIPAGTKLSGPAADLLAAVRAVESGEKPATAFFDSPASAPAPRRAAPDAAPVRTSPAPERPAPRGASPEAAASVAEVLAEGGAPEALARPAAVTLGEGAAEVLREDPWQLLSVPGVRPEQADGFARALLGAGCGPDDERRTAALVGWLLERAALRGHTAMDADEVRTALAGFAVTDPAEAVQHAVAEGVVLVFQDDEAEGDAQEPDGAEEAGEPSGEEPRGDQEPVQVLLGLDRYALAEESLADGLARLVNSCEKGADWTDAAAAAPSPSAGELIRAAATAGLVAHSGGESARAEPAALIAAAHGLGLRALGTTHSADGQRRLAAAVGDPGSAVTLSALLSGEDGPGRDADGAFALDVLVVLDAPQLDVETAAMLVESLADGTRLVLSGDPGVLGSAGAGRVFADVIAARSCPHVVSRTPDPGPIGELVSGIGIGELTQVEAPGREVVIVPVRDPGEAVHRTVQLVADSVPRAIGVPSSDTQVITVGHGGPAGTTALNTALKQRLNPGPGRFGGFDPGDRVVHVPAPGRAVPGSVVSADAEGLHLDCAGTPVVVPQERVETSVRHSWALSAHQAAGMRWPAAVVVLPGDAAQQLSRPWVYTAFSRGERHLSVVHGVDQALPRAVAEVPAQERTTRLRPLLEALPTPDAS